MQIVFVAAMTQNNVRYDVGFGFARSYERIRKKRVGEAAGGSEPPRITLILLTYGGLLRANGVECALR